MAVKRRTNASDPFNQMVGNTITNSFNESMKRKARKKQAPSVSKSLTEMFFGRKGSGKSYSGLMMAAQAKADLEKKVEEAVLYDDYTPVVAEITDQEMKDLHEPARNFLSMVQAYGGGGGGASGGNGGYGLPFFPPQPSQQDQGNYWQHQQQAPYGWSNQPNPFTPSPIEPKKAETKKEKFKPEDHKGKFCAVVMLKIGDVNHIGVLFVKKCGHWKLLDFNGNKLAGGTAGSFEPMIKKGELKIDVQRVLYDIDAPVIEESELEII